MMTYNYSFRIALFYSYIFQIHWYPPSPDINNSKTSISLQQIRFIALELIIKIHYSNKCEKSLKTSSLVALFPKKSPRLGHIIWSLLKFYNLIINFKERLKTYKKIDNELRSAGQIRSDQIICSEDINISYVISYFIFIQSV